MDFNSCVYIEGFHKSSHKYAITFNYVNYMMIDIIFEPIEIDFCAAEISRCQHLCIQTNGSFYCDCLSGYQLLSDNMTCKGC